VLFGVGDGFGPLGQVRSKGGMRGSSLYWINTITGSATLIGDIGYYVEGIAYDAITNKLYGITSSLFRQVGGSQLIEIDMATGAGSLIGTINPGEDYFSNPTFNALGTLYAVNNYRNRLCTINLTTAEADCFGNAEAAYKPASADDDDDFGPLNLKNKGLAFNNVDVLHLIVPDYTKAEYKDDDDSSGSARIYTYDADHMKFDYQRTIHGLPYNMAPNGDFDPLTGIYWGLDSLYSVIIHPPDDDDDFITSDDDDDFATKNLLMINTNEGTLVKTIPTIGNLHAITFGYLNASTLIKMGLNDLIDFLCPNNPQ
jgi:DNA-binding beta-propeller fold protein YncE